MRTGNLAEFFQDDNSGLSMSRLILFGAFMVTSVIMLRLTWTDDMSEGYLSIYLTAFVASYATSRAADYKTATIAAPPPAGAAP